MHDFNSNVGQLANQAIIVASSIKIEILGLK